MSEVELIGIIYTQLLEEFGFGYCEKDLWMIAENLAERVANKQSNLNENQQIVYTALKNNYSWFGKLAEHALFDYLTNKVKVDLSNKEFAQVLLVFSDWLLEQEEE